MSAAPTPTESLPEFAIQQNILRFLSDQQIGPDSALTLIDGERIVHVVYNADGTIAETRALHLVIGDPE